MAAEHDVCIVRATPQLSPSSQTAGRKYDAEAVGRVPDLIRHFYKTLNDFQSMFPRQFTPEGCLDQSMSDVLAAIRYELELVESHKKASLARTRDGRALQLKVTRSRKGTVGLFPQPESLLVLQRSGQELVELYNGPTALAWENAGKTRKNGERRMPVSRLRVLGQSLPMM